MAVVVFGTSAENSSVFKELFGTVRVVFFMIFGFFIKTLFFPFCMFDTANLICLAVDADWITSEDF